MQKNIVFIISIIVSIGFQAMGQDQINWLTTSEFEKAVKKENTNCFIFITNIKKEELKKIKERERTFNYLDDKNVVEYLNKNFICYKFEATTEESISFNGKSYNLLEERGKKVHEFVLFLKNNNDRIAPSDAIVLRDQNFSLFSYQKSKPIIEEMEVLLEAESLKVKYISDNLDPQNRNVRLSSEILKRQSERLKNAKENKKSKSIFHIRQNPRQLMKTLTYFETGAYQKIDLKTFKIKE